MSTAGSQIPGSGLRNFWARLKELGDMLEKAWNNIQQTPKKTIALILAIALAAISGQGAWIPTTRSTPDGILGLQFPGTRSGVLGVLALLDDADQLRDADQTGTTIGRQSVERALLFDCGFIVSYVLVLVLMVEWLVQFRFSYGPRIRRWHLVDRFAWYAPSVAGGFNYCQDAALWWLLRMQPPYEHAGVFASLTSACATIKFTLLVFVLLYLIGIGAGLVSRQSPAPPPRAGRPNRDFVFDDTRAESKPATAASSVGAASQQWP